MLFAFTESIPPDASAGQSGQHRRMYPETTRRGHGGSGRLQEMERHRDRALYQNRLIWVQARFPQNHLRTEAQCGMCIGADQN